MQSTSHSINLGVTQGIVVGPALDSMLVGDLLCSDSSFTAQYTDDINIFFYSDKKDFENLKSQIENQP